MRESSLITWWHYLELGRQTNRRSSPKGTNPSSTSREDGGKGAHSVNQISIQYDTKGAINWELPSASTIGIFTHRFKHYSSAERHHLPKVLRNVTRLISVMLLNKQINILINFERFQWNGRSNQNDELEILNHRLLRKDFLLANDLNFCWKPTTKSLYLD